MSKALSSVLSALFVACAGAAASVALAGGAIAQPPPASAYGRLPNVQDVAITPDGTRLAVLRAAGDTLGVEVVDAATYGHVGAVLAPTGITFRSVTFFNDERVLVMGTKTDNKFKIYGVRDKIGMSEYARVFSLPLDGSDSVTLLDDLTAYDFQSPTQMLTAPPDMAGAVLMPAYETSGGSRGAYTLTLRRVDLKTGKSQTLLKGGERTQQFIVGPGGKVVGRVDANEVTNSWSLMVREGAGWKPLKAEKSEYGGSPILSATLADGRILRAAKATETDDLGALMAIDPATGAETVAFAPKSAEIDGSIYDRWTGAIVGVSYTDQLPVQKFFDPELDAVLAKVAPRFAGGYVTLGDWDRARKTFVVHGEMGASPPAFYVYRPADNGLRIISAEYPEVPAQQIGVRQELKYKARDGVQIPAYLTTPQGVAAKKLPLIVLVHGGPEARDYYTFDWWASFFASRGYGVLQPNYRGSDGYGQKWKKAGHGQWGRRMQDDVSDGVAAMVKAGIADGERVCIVGASYGGYAALAGATLTPDLYKCAVSIAGVSDLLKMYDREVDRMGRGSSTADYWRSSMGPDRAQLKAASPIEHVDAVKIPVLLMHGPDDTVVPIEQSRMIESALKKAGKSVRFVLLARDDHWLSYASTRTQMLEETEKFVADAMDGSVIIPAPARN